MDFSRSSVIECADYDPDARTLEIAFRTGRRYTYFDVPDDVFDALITASSAGEYFNTSIRDQYPCREHT